MTPAEIMRLKDLLPTSLGSEDIREQIARDILARSIFSARMESAHYLQRLREVCTEILTGEKDKASAIADLGSLLEQMGHSPLDGGGLSNPASLRRLNLILDTQRQMATSVALLSEQTESTVWLYPAWELSRRETRRLPRADWPQRWQAAGDSVGWDGALTLRGITGSRMIALKSSPIWAALGSGAGGYTDTLGNPYPPFAYNSGLDWDEVDRDECIALGLITADEDIAAPGEQSLSPGGKDIQDAIARYGFPEIGDGLDLEGLA